MYQIDYMTMYDDSFKTEVVKAWEENVPVV